MLAVIVEVRHSCGKLICRRDGAVLLVEIPGAVSEARVPQMRGTCKKCLTAFDYDGATLDKSVMRG